MRYLFVLFLLFSVNVIAQEDTTIYEVQDVEPEYVDGFDAMLQWVQNSVMNLKTTEENKLCLSNIFVEFVVEKEGSISNVKARNKCNSDLSHFIKLFEKSPKWTPGEFKGEIVRSRYRLPLQIQLN